MLLNWGVERPIPTFHTSSTPDSFVLSSLTVESPLYFLSVRSLLADSNSDNLFCSCWMFRWWRISKSFFCCSCCCWYRTCAYYIIKYSTKVQRKKNTNMRFEGKKILIILLYKISLLLRESIFNYGFHEKEKSTKSNLPLWSCS